MAQSEQESITLGYLHHWLEERFAINNMKIMKGLHPFLTTVTVIQGNHIGKTPGYPIELI